MLVVYNLQNGVSMVRANGYDARVSNGDAGQQWVLDRESFTSRSQPFTEALTVEVIDRDGAGDGIPYYLLLDTDVFDADCAPSSGLNASPATVLSACHDSWSYSPRCEQSVFCDRRGAPGIAGQVLQCWCYLHNHESHEGNHVFQVGEGSSAREYRSCYENSGSQDF